MASDLKKGARITGTARDKLAADLRKKYDSGQSIRALAESSGRSYGFVHRILTESGTTPARPRRRDPAEEDLTLTRSDTGTVPGPRRGPGRAGRAGRDRGARPPGPAQRADAVHLGGVARGRPVAAGGRPGRGGPRRGPRLLRRPGPGGVRPGRDPGRARAAGAGGDAARREGDATIRGFQQAFSWLRRPGPDLGRGRAGHAVGAGFQLALACDLRVLADDATVQRWPSRATAWCPTSAGRTRWSTAVGYSRALEICLTGRRVDADEALRIGLATIVVPRAELAAAVADLVAALLRAAARTRSPRPRRCCSARRPRPGRAGGGRTGGPAAAAPRRRSPLAAGFGCDDGLADGFAVGGAAEARRIRHAWSRREVPAMTMPGGHGPWTVMRSYRRDGSVTEQKLPKGTARRIAGFARPYRWDLTVFLLTVTASAVIGVITPVLAGRVVNVISSHGAPATVVQIARPGRDPGRVRRRSSRSPSGGTRPASARA